MIIESKLQIASKGVNLGETNSEHTDIPEHTQIQGLSEMEFGQLMKKTNLLGDS